MATDVPRFDEPPAMAWTQEGTLWLVCNEADQQQRSRSDIYHAVASGDLERLAWIIDTVIPLSHLRLWDIWQACLAVAPGPVAAWVMAQIDAMPYEQVVTYGGGRQFCFPREFHTAKIAKALGATDRHDLFDEVKALSERQSLKHRIWIWIQWFHGAASAQRPEWVTRVMSSLSSDQRQALYDKMIERWEWHGEALVFLWANDPKASLEDQGHCLEQLFKTDAFRLQEPPSPERLVALLSLWEEEVRRSPHKTTWLTQVLAWRHPPVAVVVHLLDALPVSEVFHLEHATPYGNHPAFQEAQGQRRARARQAHLEARPISLTLASRRRI